MSGITYTEPTGESSSGLPLLDAANDGLSTDLATSKIAQLGQANGRAGDPAQLLESREIPMNGNQIAFGVNDGVSNVIVFDADQGISVNNNNGTAYDAVWNIGVNFIAWRLLTINATDIQMYFNGLTHKLSWNDAGDPVTQRFKFTDPLIAPGMGGVVVSIVSGITPLSRGSMFILANSTAGLVQLNVTPAAIPQQFFHIKKTSVDLNNVVINMLAGTIQGIGAPAASFTFNTQGQSVSFFSDGVNCYII